MKNSAKTGRKSTHAVDRTCAEAYTAERLAEFFLNNAMNREDYLQARTEVESMGIDPDTIDHRPLPA